uniref:ribosomal protein S17 n=1 Tax=Pseudoerythrocladia kornmannii TaxID=753682 RepID=UPI001BEF8A0D|nr:ribosomal protein S17 [Pseudoerythrocladia kornmannii]QUE28268.1 ribosomal protein S17 [Pseudoerythrocladia kornmannii]UNJ16773.1 ribosomal protein S17 [Pseudoerythrocladia kornmannii]
MATKEKIGKVISNKMDKTIVVAVENRIPHPKYGKIIVKTKKYKAHDAENSCNIGDIVKIIETRPLSKTKSWKLLTTINSFKQSNR